VARTTARRAGGTPRFDVDRLLSLARVGHLAISPDGRRLVAGVALLDPARNRYQGALWEFDPAGRRAPWRLTWSDAGEHDQVFLSDGTLLFISGRNGSGDGEAIWALPAGGGEAYQLFASREGFAAPSAGESGATMMAARAARRIAFAVRTFPDAADLAADERKAEARSRGGVNAMLLDGYPIRTWDHWLGPRTRRIYVAEVPSGARPLRAASLVEVRPGRDEPTALEDVAFELTPDGRTLLTGWRRSPRYEARYVELAAVDVRSGRRRVVISIEHADFQDLACAPDGKTVACVRCTHGRPNRADEATLVLVDIGSGEVRELATELDVRPQVPVWAPDGSALFFTADSNGHVPLFRVEVGGEDDGRVTRLTGDGAFSDACPGADGRTVHALRSSIVAPGTVCRLDGGAESRPVSGGRTPGPAVKIPARLEEGTAQAADGTPIHYWLVLPPAATARRPAPLLLLVHGGPLSSWNSWHWRWNAAVLADAGYAVLLPDPALSTGYGQAFVQRAWGAWGPRPFDDLMAALDAVVTRGDVDETRMAMMGGSYGGYMANWIAGHTDRFKAIVSHASLWNLNRFHSTTDDALWMEREFGDPDRAAERYTRNSPSLNVARIRTPMLVIHGDRDYRVPISEALHLWLDLKRHAVPSKLLFFPEENHWVLSPGNARVWYQTVLAFLDHHVRGRPWAPPATL
jgi:dipeptidyl aminopeptidase/acylaminoacyl peptidase